MTIGTVTLRLLPYSEIVRMTKTSEAELSNGTSIHWLIAV